MLKKVNILKQSKCVLFGIFIILLFFAQTHYVSAMSAECSQEHAKMITEYKDVPKMTANLNRIHVNLFLFSTELDKAIEICKGTINEPSLKLLKAQLLEENFLDTKKAISEYQSIVINFKTKYPSFAENAMFKKISIEFIQGDCKKVLNSYSTFTNYFPNPRESYQKTLTGYVNACNKKAGIDKNSVKLFDKGYGEGKKLDVLFFAYNYKLMDKFIEDAEFFAVQGSAYILRGGTLSEYKYKNKFNFYYYNIILDKNDCNNGTDKDNGNSCACNEKKLKKIAKNAGMDRYVVLINSPYDDWCRSNAELMKRAYITTFPLTNKVSRLNSYITDSMYYKDIVAQDLYAPNGQSFEDFYKDSKPTDIYKLKFYTPDLLVYIHEMDHAFYGLADEYVEKGKIDDPHKPNCAPSKKTAHTWWEDLEGEDPVGGFETNNPVEKYAKMVYYFNGCSYVTNNWRPVFNTIMRRHWDFGYAHIKASYGPVNDWWIKNYLDKYDD